MSRNHLLQFIDPTIDAVREAIEKGDRVTWTIEGAITDGGSTIDREGSPQSTLDELAGAIRRAIEGADTGTFSVSRATIPGPPKHGFPTWRPSGDRDLDFRLRDAAGGSTRIHIRIEPLARAVSDE